MTHPLRLLALVGPTASGKTPLSLSLAQRLKGEIVSADSRQVYRYLDIGTAKPSAEERRSVPHHLIDILDPDQPFSAGEYGRLARSVIEEITARDATPILVGGSGLYVRAAIDGLFEGPGSDPEVRSALESRLEREGLQPLFEELRHVDPDAAVRMKHVTGRRVIRALEVFYISGKPLSALHAQEHPSEKLEVLQFAIAWDRQKLYERIDARTEQMIHRGLVDECQGLLDRGYTTHLNSLNTVGYKEVFDYIAGRVRYEDMVERIKMNTRRFAKRQLTWFRSDKRIRWLPIASESDFPRAADRIIRSLQKGE